MSLTQQQYDRAIADLSDLQTIVGNLPELAQLLGAVKTLAPPPPVVIPAVTTPSLEKLPNSVWPTVIADANQIVRFELHGSSGEIYRGPLDPVAAKAGITDAQHGFGDLFMLHGDASMGAADGVVTYINVWDDAGYNVHPGTVKVVHNDLTLPAGKTAPTESGHSGFILADGKFHPVTEARLRYLAQQVKTLYPVADASRIHAEGWSMGAWASLSWAWYQTDLFSHVVATMPRWRGRTVWDYVKGTSIATPAGLKMADGSDFAARYDAVARAADPTIRTVPLIFTIGMRDQFVPAQETLDGIAGLKAGKRWFACEWNQGDHGSAPVITDLTRTYSPALFKLGQGLPRFFNSSRDQDPTKDLIGGINVGFLWRNVVEDANGFKVDLTNVDGPCEVDVEPLSPVFTAAGSQHVSITAAGEWHTLTFSKVAAPPPVVTTAIASKTVTRPQAAIVGAAVPDRYGHNLRVGFHSGGRYDRWQNAIELTGATPWPTGPSSQWGPDGFGPTTTFIVYTEDVVRADKTVGPLQFGGAYTLTINVNGKPVGSTTVTANDGVASISVPMASLPEGWVMVNVSGLPAGWGSLDYPMFVRKTAKAVPQAQVPVVVGSHTWGHRHIEASGAGQYSSAWVPAVFAPVEIPLAPRTYPPLLAFGSMTDLAYTMLAPYRPFDVYRPSRLKSGAITTANNQNYQYADISKPLPTWATLGGKRGRGNIVCPTSLRESGRPTGGKVTGTEPWRAFAVDDDGTVRTLAGYEHDNAMPQFTNVPNDGVQQYPLETPKLVGDWSAVPATRRGFRELWDIAWDSDTTTIDQSSPLVGGEHTHVTGPVAFVTDTRNGRVCRLAFSANDRSAPCIVTEFVTGLNAPWGCEILGNELFVTEQGGRIGVYDKHTGALLRSTAYTRPEGMRLMGGLLYVGSRADLTVKKVDPVTLAVVGKFCDVPSGGMNSNFVNVAVGDDTFLPGHVATVTWSNGEYGFPALFDPTGKRVAAFGSASGNLPNPKGAPAPFNGAYATAVSMGKGRITFGTVQEGLHRLSVALPTDTDVPAPAWQGAQKWDALDLPLVYGDNGFGFYGLPLPWGKYGPDVDAYLRAMGHA